MNQQLTAAKMIDFEFFHTFWAIGTTPLGLNTSATEQGERLLWCTNVEWA
jgi:hypothetical protein